jgi:putative aldouronate transport system permease protein
MISSKTRIRESLGDRLFLACIYILLTLVLIVVLYPLIYIASSSISDPLAVASGRVWLWPVDISFLGYKFVLQNQQIIWGYGNSLIYTIGATLISVTSTVIFAYPLSRKTFWGRNALMMFITFTMLFGGGLIPTYMVVKYLGMVDTRWALLIPGAIGVWSVIITRTFFQTSIPDELADASEMDGCSDLRFLWSVVLPLSKPILAVLCLFTAVGQWNSYFDALIYLKSQQLYPLQLVLRNILILNSSAANPNTADLIQQKQLADLMKYSLIMIANLPVFIIYPFIQKHFVQGVLVGSLKG